MRWVKTGCKVDMNDTRREYTTDSYYKNGRQHTKDWYVWWGKASLNRFIIWTSMMSEDNIRQIGICREGRQQKPDWSRCVRYKMRKHAIDWQFWRGKANSNRNMPYWSQKVQVTHLCYKLTTQPEQLTRKEKTRSPAIFKAHTAKQQTQKPWPQPRRDTRTVTLRHTSYFSD